MFPGQRNDREINMRELHPFPQEGHRKPAFGEEVSGGWLRRGLEPSMDSL